jgi:hypothetical protein
MSPEQHRGEATDSRCDQFSFCAALYEALYKTSPFAGQTLAELRDNVLAGNLKPPPERASVPARVYAALRRGLLPDPEHRFPSMRELLAALAFDPQRDPAAAPRARRLFSRIMISIVMLLLLALDPALRRAGMTQELRTLVPPTVFLSVLGLLAFVFRRTLLRNEFHRGTVFLVGLYSVEQLCMRGLALLVGISPKQLLPLELVGLASVAALMAYFFLRRAWISTPFLLGMALWLARHPEHGAFVSSTIYPAAVVGMVIMWERAAWERADGSENCPLASHRGACLQHTKPG